MGAWKWVLLAAVLPVFAQAEQSSSEAGSSAVSYVSLMPPIVGNYLSDGRLKLFKADIALRVLQGNAKSVEHHEALIRDQLVTLFSAQSDETLQGAPAREALRSEALARVRAVLETEEGKPLVDDLLFNNLIVQ